MLVSEMICSYVEKLICHRRPTSSLLINNSYF